METDNPGYSLSEGNEKLVTCLIKYVINHRWSGSTPSSVLNLNNGCKSVANLTEVPPPLPSLHQVKQPLVYTG
jgi:hypothetical protein